MQDTDSSSNSSDDDYGNVKSDPLWDKVRSVRPAGSDLSEVQSATYRSEIADLAASEHRRRRYRVGAVAAAAVAGAVQVYRVRARRLR